MQVRCHVRLSGPLTAYAEGFGEDLIDRGYAPARSSRRCGFSWM